MASDTLRAIEHTTSAALLRIDADMARDAATRAMYLALSDMAMDCAALRLSRVEVK